MASLTLTIGALSASKSASNAKASALTEEYADALGATGTNQERLDAVVLGLVRHMQQQAQAYRARAAQTEAMTAAAAEIAGLLWEP